MTAPSDSTADSARAQASSATLPPTLARLGGKLPAWGWALLFAVVLVLPRLGSYGFWDPWELGAAERARLMATKGMLFDVTVGDAKAWPPVPPLGPVIQAVGIKVFGASEWGARLPLGLIAIGAIMAVYWAGGALFRRRAALLAALALGSMSMFVYEARQVISDAPLVAALALAIGGFGRFAWPRQGKRRPKDAALGALGLVLGFLAGGALLGVVLPLAALIAAIAVGWTLEPTSTPDPDVAGGGEGPDVPLGKPFGESVLHPRSPVFFLFAALAAIAVALAVLSLTGHTIGKHSILLGGAPKAGQPEKLFEYLIEQLGFGLFPWGGLAIFALARPLIRLDEASAATAGRLVFGQLLVLFLASFGYAASGYLVIMLGDARYVALAAVALAIGALLDELLEGRRSESVLGLVVAIGTLLIGRDFFLNPEEIASAHLSSKVKWPTSIPAGRIAVVVSTLFAAALYFGAAARARAIGAEAAPDLATARPWRRRLDALWVQAGRWGTQAAVALALLWALGTSHVLIPALSKHFSFKNVLGAFEKYASTGAPLAKYRVEGKGAGFYSKNIVDLGNQQQAADFLKKKERVFLLINAEDLPTLHAAFKTQQIDYKVVDSSSSRFLLLSNQLGAGEKDSNPLSTNVRTDPFPDPRVKVSASFEGKIELLGADFPAEASRPGHIPFSLYFKVKERVGGSYKVFMHLDAPGAPRTIGDHDVVNKAYPTSSWVPGEYIRDDYQVEIPLMTVPAGTYTVWIGFWPGGEGKRLKITEGDNDGADRIRIGTVEVK